MWIACARGAVETSAGTHTLIEHWNGEDRQREKHRKEGRQDAVRMSLRRSCRQAHVQEFLSSAENRQSRWQRGGFASCLYLSLWWPDVKWNAPGPLAHPPLLDECLFLLSWSGWYTSSIFPRRNSRRHT